MTLDVHRPVAFPLAVLAALAVLMVGLALVLSRSTAPVVVLPADQPATPANELSDSDTWSATGCFLPGAAIDAVPGVFDFRHACTHHGGCYAGLDRQGQPAVVDRARCDQLFRRDLEASCTVFHGTSTDRRAQECATTAESYYAVARSFGGPYYRGSGSAA